MDSQQQQEEMNMMSINGGKMSSNYLCRQSSTRWTPTTEQIKLLKELYYINGVRSPTADQIQSICARLRRYGKIEGKNVFYWFQNHKARERQKKKLTPTSPTTNNTVPNTTNPQFHNNCTRNNFIKNGGLTWKQNHQDITIQAKYPCTINNPGVSCSSSSAGHVNSGGGQLMESFGYGGVTMENKFRDCSISGGGVLINGGDHVNQSTAVGTNYCPYTPASYSNFLDKISSIDEDPCTGQDHYGAETPEIETLPLFPMHNEEHDNDHDHDHGQAFYTIKPPSDGYYTGGYRWSNGSGGNTSLELSLNSYGYGYYSPNL